MVAEKNDSNLIFAEVLGRSGKCRMEGEGAEDFKGQLFRDGTR